LYRYEIMKNTENMLIFSWDDAGKWGKTAKTP
jgi:hypothetical protein